MRLEKALSIKNPWAYLIAMGIKDVENRTWKTNFRGRIYIHVSGKDDPSMKSGKDYSIEQWEFLTCKDKGRFLCMDLLNSAIIGEVNIIDCVEKHPSIWAENQPGVWKWVLENPVIYEDPITNVKGALSFWKYPKTKKL